MEPFSTPREWQCLLKPRIKLFLALVLSPSQAKSTSSCILQRVCCIVTSQPLPTLSPRNAPLPHASPPTCHPAAFLPHATYDLFVGPCVFWPMYVFYALQLMPLPAIFTPHASPFSIHESRLSRNPCSVASWIVLDIMLQRSSRRNQSISATGKARASSCKVSGAAPADRCPFNASAQRARSA